MEYQYRGMNHKWKSNMEKQTRRLKMKTKLGWVIFTEHRWFVYQTRKETKIYKKKSKAKAKPGRSQWRVPLSSESWSWYSAPTRESYRTVIPTCSGWVSHPQTLSSYPSTYSGNLPHRTCTRKTIVILTKPIYHTLSRSSFIILSSYSVN